MELLIVVGLLIHADHMLKIALVSIFKQRINYEQRANSRAYQEPINIR